MPNKKFKTIETDSRLAQLYDRYIWVVALLINLFTAGLMFIFGYGLALGNIDKKIQEAEAKAIDRIMPSVNVKHICFKCKKEID